MKIIDYKIAKGNNRGELQEESAFMLKQGYQPHGSMVADPDSGLLFQPFVKYEKELVGVFEKEH